MRSEETQAYFQGEPNPICNEEHHFDICTVSLPARASDQSHLPQAQGWFGRCSCQVTGWSAGKNLGINSNAAILPAELTGPKRRWQMFGRFNPSSWVTVLLDGRLGFVTAYILPSLHSTRNGLPLHKLFSKFSKKDSKDFFLFHCIA